MPHADRRIRSSLGLLAVLGLSATPLACGLDQFGSAPVSTGGTADAGATGGSGGMGGEGGMGGTGGGLPMCTQGAACYSGPAGTEDVGNCAAGTQVCMADGTGFCDGQTLPAMGGEDCAEAGDEDCNGFEGAADPACICTPLEPAACTVPNAEGACAVGQGTCSNDGKTVEGCMQVTQPAFDDCTTMADEDCDGTAISMCTGEVEGGFTPAGKNTDPMDDAIYDVEITPDGGYVIAGVVDADVGADLFGVSAASIYVAKFGPDNMMSWERKYPIMGSYGVTRGVAVGPTGNVAVVGEFGGTVDFGGGNMVSQDGDIFVTMLDAMGAHVWSKRVGVSNTQSAQDVEIDGAGNLYVTGWVESDALNLGSGTVDPWDEDIFLASYDAAGNHRWSRIFVSQYDQRGRRLALTPSGRVALLGDTWSSLNIGGSNLAGGGERDLVVGLYDAANGNHVWSRLFGSAGDQVYGGIAISSGDNVVITGRFAGTLDFGGGVMTAAGATDVYLAELAAANGSHVRSARFGVSGQSRGSAVAVDGAGNVVVAGHFDVALDFGAGQVTTGEALDVFVVKLSAASWSPLWTKTFGVTGTQTAWGVAVDPKGDVIVGGSFESQIAFGGALGTITSSGGADLFSVRLAP